MKRYQYDEITESEPTVTRYKLYKAKKQWVIQGMTTVALLLGAHEAAVHGVPGLLSPSITTAKADSIDDQSQPTNTLNGDVQASQVTDQSQDTSTNSPVATIDSSSEQTTTSDQQSQADNQQTTNNQATQVENNQSKSQTTAVTKTVTKKAGQQTVTKASVSATKATVQKASTVKVKNAADFNKQATKVTKQAQKVSASVNKVVKTDAARANAKSTDKVVHNSGLDALKTHVDSEAQQVQAALKVATINNAKSLTQMQDSLTQANSLLQTMRTELDVANSMLREDKQGVDAKQVARSKQALHKLVLPEGTTAKVDEYGDLVVSTSNHAGYQAVLNQMDSMGLTKSFRNVVDPVQFYYGLKNYTDAQILSDAKLNVKSALGSLDINTDGKTITDMPFANGANVTFYNSVLPYWTKLQDAFKDGSAADIVTAASEFLGASNAVGDITTHGNFQTNSDQKQSTNHTSFALILNVDEFGNPIFTEDYNSSVKAGDLVNNRGLVVDPTDPSTDNGATLSTILLSPSGNSNLTYFTGEVGTEIANPTIKETVPNFTYTGKTDYSTGSSKLVSILGGTTPQIVINHWQSNTTPTPTVTAIKAQVGTVTKIEDGTTTFTTVPTVTLSGESGLKVPDLTISDFDWSKVQATAGTYAITLNDSGIKKITDANANTTLATSDITPGQAIIKAKEPTIVAIKATVGDVTKTEDGTTTFTTIPTVTLSGESGLKVPTLGVSDFDWSKVQATAGTYSITLNDSGIKKITDANANTSLATSDITPGQAIIKAKVPTVTAIKATVGTVTKTEDGTTTFTTVPTVTLSGESGLKVPDLTVSDFDWSKVQAAAGTYSITLNDSGIKKITAANANTSLATSDITPGQAIIKAKTPTIVAIKATVGDVTKTEDGTTTFTDVPGVALTGEAGLKVPTLSASDFDWSKVQATAGTYSITLNDSGIKKITDANANTTLAVSDITPGQAIIKAKVPTDVAIKATVSDITKVYDGTTSFDKLPEVTLSGKSVLATPTFTAADFDWSNVKADAGTYHVTLNASGIKKITDANSNTTLVSGDVTAGTVTINKAAVKITANDSGKTQGQVDPQLTARISGKPTSGADLKYSVTRTAGETPGTYDINVTFNAADNPNYSINVTKGTFTIVAPDTILATVGNVTKVYDGTTAFPTTSLPKVTLSGTNTVMPTFTHDDFDWSKVQANAGSYQVTLNTNGLKKITDANKGAAASATNGDAIVTKAAITIKANDGTKVDGQKDPDLTATVTGQPTAGSKPVYTVTRTAGETAGTYDIIVTANATDNPNYTIQTEKGTFTITDATTNFKWTAVYVDGNGLQLATPESGANLANGASYTTSAKYIDGYYLTAQPANASGKIANGDVTVKYVYNKVGSYDIVAPNGQRTTIAYAVDHTDPTKVSIPTNQVVPYVNGYYAVGLTGKLSLVDSSNPALGYKLPAFITASLNTPIVYVAVNGGGGGGNNNNGGGGNSGGGSNTPSNNNNGNGGSNNNNNSNNTNGNTVPSGNTTPGNGGNTPTPSQPNKPTKPNKGSQSNNGSKTNGSNKGSSQKPSANGSSTPRTTTGQNGQSGFGGYTTNGVKPTRTGYPVVQGNEMTGRDQSSLKNMPVSKATTLPQTGDTNSSAISWIGVALVGLLGMFGYKRRKHS
ncbi:MBG domain-containing protein [Lentilactobacillus parabuchneri]|uniref:MBG domain-containing protein n=2 Tax=Lentilactobacillus parabuchneri TaxID=152331 RepID=UPI000A25D0BD|nr:MBG domain-containing protein [Lentilactobacillus parabuchneri]ORN34945.1 Beta-galactosidase [Lentilactobacillus parabuchneri]ORN35400.1 Beta-galactosidase [Lentilactobacillus parabuchneri]ORN38365.1 Beta-galactosidase [Lentilactobacillus parabuchneri]